MRYTYSYSHLQFSTSAELELQNFLSVHPVRLSISTFLAKLLNTCFHIGDSSYPRLGECFKTKKN